MRRRPHTAPGQPQGRQTGWSSCSWPPSRAIEPHGLTARFGRFTPRDDDDFKMPDLCRLLGGKPYAGLHQTAVSGFESNFAEIAEIERLPRNAPRADEVGLLLAHFVGDADLVAITDIAVRQHDIKRLTNLVDGTVEAAPRTDAVGEGGTHQNERRPIADGFQPFPLNPGCRRDGSTQVLFRIVSDEAARIIERIHNAIARIDAQSARNALVLQAVADVDAGGTDLHAEAAIDAVAQSLFMAFGKRALSGARSGPPMRRFAAPGVVMHGQRLGFIHHALEAAVRANVGADLLAHQACGGVGGEREDADRLAVLQEQMDVLHDLLHGVDYADFRTKAWQRLPAVANHVLGLTEGKKRFADTVLAASKAFTLCCTLDEALAHRDELAFLQAVT